MSALAVTGAVCFLLGLCTARVWRRIRGGRPGDPRQLDRRVTELGEAVAGLSFDPAAPSTTQAAVAVYQRVLDCYDRARDAHGSRRIEHTLTTAWAAISELAELTRESAEIDQAVTDLGADLERLRSHPSLLAGPESARDYRRAVDARDLAGQALLGEQTDVAQARRALAAGRNAYLRLEARAHHRPVPIDLSDQARRRGAKAPPPPVQDTRFTYSGRSGASYEFPIDWPVPGQDALMELTLTGAGRLGSVSLSHATLTDTTVPANRRDWYRSGSVESGNTGRFALIAPDTHLAVRPLYKEPGGTWTLRLLPLDQAAQLRRELPGEGDDVVILKSGGRARVGVDVDGDVSWSVDYHCLDRRKGHRLWCGMYCYENLTNWSPGQDTLKVCGNGLLLVHASHNARWYLTLLRDR